MLNPQIFNARAARFNAIENGGVLDVFIVGGGISGAPLYDTLSRRGYRVALVDKGDFASGTSQASGMLVWGGLLYLKNLDFGTVARLCMARKALLDGYAHDIAPLDIHYLTGNSGLSGKAFVWAAMQLYWLIGACELNRPHFKTCAAGGSIVYQEGMLHTSDSRFVIERIAAHDSHHCIAINHCRMTGAARDAGSGVWRIELKDELTGAEHQVCAKVLVNAAGIWSDEINRIAGIESPYKHVLSKGVYLAFPGENPTEARVYPMHGRDDVLTHVPWGPVSMWGPTETSIRDLDDGLSPDREDIRFLLQQAQRSLGGQHRTEDVVSIRCGIRPLAVPRNFNRDVYPLSLSRRHQVALHREQMALSLYGGKFTSGIAVAEHAAELVKRWVSPSQLPSTARVVPPDTVVHTGLDHAFVTPEWARDHEYCTSLDDYLRRRTNIAQWTPRMGIGNLGENRNSMLETAAAFVATPQDAWDAVNAYEQRVLNQYDPLLAS